jgi:hypothetical protein
MLWVLIVFLASKEQEPVYFNNLDTCLFKKLFAGSSVEQEAMDAFAAKKKAEAMEEELRTWINMVHGPNAWSDLLKMQAKIRKERQETLYKQAELRRNMIQVVGVILLGIVFVGAIVGTLWMFVQRGIL